MSVKYAEGYKVKLSRVPRRGILQLAPGQGEDGYGSKISTDRMIRFDGEKRWYRVFAVCYSNAASHYVVRKGETLYCRGYELDAFGNFQPDTGEGAVKSSP